MWLNIAITTIRLGESYTVFTFKKSKPVVGVNQLYRKYWNLCVNCSVDEWRSALLYTMRLCYSLNSDRSSNNTFFITKMPINSSFGNSKYYGLQTFARIQVACVCISLLKHTQSQPKSCLGCLETKRIIEMITFFPTYQLPILETEG